MRTFPTRPLRRLDTRTRLLTAAIVGCYAALPAFAQLPSGMSVQSGSATASQSGNALTVTNSNGAILHWDSFSIAKGYTTHFAQSSASSSVLNRVVGASPSEIYGTLSSNGKVWLINPNGVLVGAGGMVNTAGFVASTLDVSNANFLAGKLAFNKTPGAKDVVNQGTIITPSGGSVYLVGANVSNEGLITTPQGETILAAGETVELLDTGTPGVKVEITGAAGNATNLGTILADAGRIGMAGVIVKNSGTLNASSVVREGGRIFLRASQDTYVDGNGRIVATGTKGGQVEVLGNRVAVMDNAAIDVSGTNDGGTVLVGGDFQGNNAAIRNAQMTYFGPQAVIKADATENGNGGKVVIWSDDTTRAYGRITARGGADGGDGGLVETSGKRALEAWARVSTEAPRGRTGTFLLDPVDITIDSSTMANYGPGSTDYGGTPLFVHDTYPGSTAAISWYYLKDSLASTDVIIQTKTSTASPGNGDITFTGAMSYNQAHSLTLLAQRNINFTTGSIQNSGAGSISLVAGWDGGSQTSPNTTAGTGTISLSAGTSVSTNGTIDVKTGNNLSLNAASITSGGSMAVSARGAVNVTNGSMLYAGTSGGAATQQVSAVGDITVSAGGGGITAIKNGGTGLQQVISSGGGIAVTGGSVSTGIAKIETAGSQYVKAKTNVTVTAGAGPGAYAGLWAGTGQTIQAVNLSLLGNAANGAYLSGGSTGTQLLALSGALTTTRGHVSGSSVVIAAASADMDNGSSIAANNGTFGAIVGGDVSLKNGSSIGALKDVVMQVGGNMALSDSSSIAADYGYDIYLGFTGASSTLSLSSGSYVMAGRLTTIYLEFTTRTSGGVVIDGVQTTVNSASGAGFYSMDTSTPAVLGNGLEILYATPTTGGGGSTTGGGTATDGAIDNRATSDVIKSVSDITRPQWQPASTPTDLPPATSSDEGQSTGGREGEFGEGKKGSGKRPVGRCKA